MIEKLEKLKKLWEHHEKQIKLRSQFIKNTINNELEQKKLLENYLNDYKNAIGTNLSYEKKVTEAFCEHLKIAIKTQETKVAQLKNELQHLEKLYSLYYQRINNLEKIINKKTIVLQKEQIRKEVKQIEDLFRSFTSSKTN